MHIRVVTLNVAFKHLLALDTCLWLVLVAAFLGHTQSYLLI
jgi:hypothetical protein